MAVFDDIKRGIEEAINYEKRTKSIDCADDNFGAVINCAVRYCMGRNTYMPHLVIGFVEPLLDKLSDRTLWCLDRDLSEPLIYGGLGDQTIDAPIWLAFHEKIKAVMQERKENNGN